MPRIDESLLKPTKKFKKVEYRPWENINEESSSELKPCAENVEVIKTVKDESNVLDRELYKLRRSLLPNHVESLSYLARSVDYIEGEYVYFVPVFFSEVPKELGYTASNFRAHVQKLRKLGLVEVAEIKPGRGGYSCYRMHKNKFTFFFPDHKNKLA